MGERNKRGLARHIPAAIKRQVRQECGFGCVLCGGAIFQYDHFAPSFEEAVEHSPEGIALLCAGCHDRRHRGLLPTSAVAKARLDPFCRVQGTSCFPLALEEGPLTVVVGGIEVVGVERLIEIEGVEVLRVRPPEEKGGPHRLSARFFDRRGVQVARIADNEWRGSKDAWDIESRGSEMKVRSRLHNIDLLLNVAGPSCVAVKKLHLDYAGVEIIADPHEIEVQAGKARFRVPGDLPPVRAAPVFLKVREGKITVGSDRVAGLSDPPGGPERDVRGTIETVGGARVEFVDPKGTPLAGRFPGRKVLRVQADKGEGVVLTYKIPPGGGVPRLVQTLPKCRKARATPNRNDPCPCGSGSKYKRCHGRPY